MAVVEVMACPDLFWCEQCTPVAAPLEGSDAKRGVRTMATEHHRATGHRARGIIGNRMSVNRCKDCQNRGIVLAVQARLGGSAQEVEVPCPHCYYDAERPWQ